MQHSRLNDPQLRSRSGSVDDAEKVSFLFDGSTGGWFGGLNLRKFPRDERLALLRTVANQAAAQRNWVLPFPELAEAERAREGKAEKDRTSEEAERHQRVEQEQTDRAKSKSSREQSSDPLTAMYLEVLGLSSLPANADQLKTAYRNKLRQYHPDMYANERPEIVRMAEEGTRRINEAFKFLKRLYGAD